ncbi:MAG: S8 family serine peptidase, partial [Planctomycetota bacterium]
MTRRLRLEVLEDRRMLSSEPSLANSLLADAFERQFTDSPSFDPSESLSNSEVSELHEVTRSIIPNEFVIGIRQDTEWVDALESFAFDLTTSLGALGNLSFADVLSLTDPNDQALSVVHVSYDGETSLDEMLAFAASATNVSWAAPNYQYSGALLDFVPDDPLFVDQYHHTLMGNPVAWDITLGDSDVVIAITDQGVERSHPDLAPNIWENTAEVRGVAGVDDDGNGFIDDFNGWDFVSNDNDPDPLISNDDHGTHVAGIAAGVTNNSNQIAGTAGNASIMPLRISGADGGFTSVIMANAFAYAIDNGARIANTSYNINGFVGDPTFTAGLQYFYDNGGLHFNSAGNSDQLNPARQAFHQTLLVASTTSSDEKSGFSNYGSGIDIAAPGSSILSTETNGGTGTKSGTSMAAPNAAGAAALIWSANPEYSRDQVAAQLLGTADNIDGVNPAYIGLLGTGRVNTGRALTETLPAPTILSLNGLPDEGAVGKVGSSFELRFDQVMDPGSIAPGSFDLRNAGANGVFGDSDDIVYGLSHDDYLIGTNSLVFEILGSPLQRGSYRLTASSEVLQNPFQTALDGDGDGVGGDNFVRSFGIPPTVTVDPLLTNDTAPALTGTVDDPTATIVVEVAGQAGLVAVNNGDGTWTLPDDTLAPLLDGSYDVLVSATDITSFTGVDSTTDELTIDTTLIRGLITDYFRGDSFDPLNWNSVAGATIDTVGIDEPSVPYAARFNGDPAGGDSIESVVLDLSSVLSTSIVELRYFFQQTGGGESPAVDEDLIVEFRDESLVWVELERQLGSGPDMTSFERSIVTLPTAALHASSQLRFRNTASPGVVDDWFVDNVELLELVAPAAPPTVTVNRLLTSDATPALTGTVDDPQATIIVDVAGQTGLSAINNGDGTWVLPDNTLAAVADGTYDVVVYATDSMFDTGVDGTLDELTVDSAFLRTRLAEFFPIAVFDPTNWAFVDNATIDTVGIGEPSPPHAARLSGGTMIETVALDLSNVASFELAYFFQRTGGGESPDLGDDLIVEYRDISSTWVELERQLGGGPDMSMFEQRIVALPPAALHANSQMRFRNAANASAFDDWFLDDIELLEFIDEDAPVVTIDFLVTSDRMPALTGTVDDPSAVIVVDVAQQIGLAAINNGDGTWMLPANTLDSLMDGTYEVVVTATDLSLNAAADESTNELTIDNLAPVVTVDPLLTSDPTPMLTGSVDDHDATILVSVAGQAGVAATNNGDGTWTLPNGLLGPFVSGTYDVMVTATDAANNVGVDESTDELTIDTGSLVTIYAANMTVDPGWTFSVPGANKWAWGIPLGLDGDPDSGFSGSNVIGYNLSGQYASSLSEEYATTPPIDMRGHTNVSLSFWRWLGIEQARWDQAAIEVSNNGADWTTVWRHSGNDLVDTNWKLQEYDISGVADNQQSVQLRWVMGETDSFGNFAGWNIDDVVIQGVQIDLPPAVTIDALITSDPTPALTGTVDDPAASILVDVAGQTGLAAINHGDGTWTLPDDTLAELANGTYDVTVTAIDAGSNV